MKNNESRESLNDEFWEILDESSNESMDALLKRRRGMSADGDRPEKDEEKTAGLPVEQAGDELPFSHKKGIGEEEAEADVLSDYKASALFCGGSSSPPNREAMEGIPLAEGEREPSDQDNAETSNPSSVELHEVGSLAPGSDEKKSKLSGISDDFFSDSEDGLFPVRKRERASEVLSSQKNQGALRPSSDGMDFLWDDEDEDFVVGGLSRLKVSEEPQKQEAQDYERTREFLTGGLDAVVLPGEHGKAEEKPNGCQEALAIGETRGSFTERQEPSSGEMKEHANDATHKASIAESLVAKTPVPRAGSRLDPLHGKSGVAETPQPAGHKTKYDPLRPKPLCRFVDNHLLTFCCTNQKRFSAQGQETSRNVVIASILAVDYKPPNISPGTFKEHVSTHPADSYSFVYRLLEMKNPDLDKMALLIGAPVPSYAHSDIAERAGINEVDEFMRLCFESKERALSYAVERRMWAFALLISNRDSAVVDGFLGSFANPPCVPFIRAMFSMPSDGFRLEGAWRAYFNMVFRSRDAALVESFIRQVSLQSHIDALFLVTVCHLLGAAEIDRYLELFSRNFEALRVLCYLESISRTIRGLDVLRYEYTMVLSEYDRPAAVAFYNSNKKCFRRELRERLDSVLSTKWSFGLRNVFDFGLKKILDVDYSSEKEADKSREPEQEREDGTNVGTYNGMELRPGMSAAAESRELLMKPVFKPKITRMGAEREAAKEKTMHPGNADESNESPEPAQHDEEKGADEAKAFLSKFNEDEELPAQKEAKPEKRDGSFFGFLNVFKRSPVHKVRIDADGDFKYDPATNKWISSAAQMRPPESPAMQPRSIPKPSLEGRRSDGQSLEGTYSSLYANKKSVENRGIPGAFGKKN
jgi:hypothetical protein